MNCICITGLMPSGLTPGDCTIPCLLIAMMLNPPWPASDTRISLFGRLTIRGANLGAPVWSTEGVGGRSNGVGGGAGGVGSGCLMGDETGIMGIETGGGEGGSGGGLGGDGALGRMRRRGWYSSSSQTVLFLTESTTQSGVTILILFAV